MAILDNSTIETVNIQVEYAIGPRGYSAYEIAVQNGFVGTQEEWEASLVGPKGDAFTFDDFTPEEIELLQQPAIDAAEIADVATNNANIATGLANTATANANTATANAISATNAALEAALVANSARGWQPEIGLESDGDTREVQKLIGWVGGTGSTPIDYIGKYIGSTGFVNTKAEATNVKGIQGNAADVTRTSTTSNSIAIGSKTFGYATTPNIGWVVGSRLRAYNSAGNYMSGVVTAVSGTSVTILIDYIVGSGTYTSWNLGLAGDNGVNGSATITVWTATTFLSGSLVSHLGKYWRANANTVTGDVPGTSGKWVEELTAYIPKTDIVNDLTTGGTTKPLSAEQGKILAAKPSFGITADDITNWNNAYKVYGVEWDVTVASTTLKRIGNLSLHVSLPIQSLMRRCILNDAGSVVYYLDANNSTLKADGTSAVLDGTDGQVMVEIPEHYISFETVGNTRRCLMSLYFVAGFTRVPKSYIGAYEASVDRAASKLASVVNTTTNYRGGNNNATNDANPNTLLGRPVSGNSRNTYTVWARNRGSIKWNGLLYDIRKTVFWLYMVEYAQRNSQTAFDATLTTEGYKKGGLGNGATDVVSGDWTTFNGQYPVLPCGLTNSLGNSTGEITYSITGWAVTKSVKVPSYRGIENIFGHISELNVDINIRAKSVALGGTLEVYAAKSLTFSDVDYTNYNLIGLQGVTTDFAKEIIFGSNGDIVPSVTTGASATTYWCDYNYPFRPASGEILRAAYSSGALANGVNTGLAVFYGDILPSAGLPNLGSRLCYMPEGVA